MLFQFQADIKVIQLYICVYIYIFIFTFSFIIAYYKILSILLCLYSRSLSITYFI